MSEVWREMLIRHTTQMDALAQETREKNIKDWMWGWGRGIQDEDST